MADIEDRLAPRDGLNNYNVILARMDLPSHGSAQFTFAVTNSMLPVAEVLVNVPASGQSLDRMTVEAHDQLIDILRQLTFRAEKARLNHEKNTRPAAPLVEEETSPADRRGLDRIGAEALTEFEVEEATPSFSRV